MLDNQEKEWMWQSTDGSGWELIPVTRTSHLIGWKGVFASAVYLFLSSAPIAMADATVAAY